MANTRTGNTVFIDAEGAAIVGTNQPIKVAYILFTPDTASDQMILRETENGANKIHVRAKDAKNTMQFDFALKPLVFANGIFVDTLTTGATAVLVTTQAGD